MRKPISGVPKDTESSEDDETETDTADENEDNGRTIVSKNDSSIGIQTVTTTAAIVLQEVTGKMDYEQLSNFDNHAKCGWTNTLHSERFPL